MSPVFAPSHGKLLQILNGPEMFCRISMFAMSSLTFMASVSLSWVRRSTKAQQTLNSHRQVLIIHTTFFTLSVTIKHFYAHLCEACRPDNTTLFIDWLDEALALLASKTKEENFTQIKLLLQICWWRLIGFVCFSFLCRNVVFKKKSRRLSFLTIFEWALGISWVKLTLLQKHSDSEIQMKKTFV